MAENFRRMEDWGQAAYWRQRALEADPGNAQFQKRLEDIRKISAMRPAEEINGSQKPAINNLMPRGVVGHILKGAQRHSAADSSSDATVSQTRLRGPRKSGSGLVVIAGPLPVVRLMKCDSLASVVR